MELDCEPLETLRLPLRAWRYSGIVEERRSEEIRRGGDGRTGVVEEEGSGREAGGKKEAEEPS